jgi:hypothetical protein
MFAAMFNYLDLSNLISSITIVIVREYFTLVHLEDKHLDSFLILSNIISLFNISWFVVLGMIQPPKLILFNLMLGSGSCLFCSSNQR